MEQINYRAASEELVAYAKRIKAILSLSDLLDKGASLQDQVNELEKRKELAKEALISAEGFLIDAEKSKEKALLKAQEIVQKAVDEAEAIIEKNTEQARLDGDKIRTEAAKDVKELVARSNSISTELAKSEAILKANTEKIAAQEKTLADLKDNLRKIKETL